MISDTPTNNARKPLRGIRRGIVVSDKRDQSRKVEVAYQRKHPKYGKYVQRNAWFHVHDPQNLSSEGDTVEIVPCRPISKTKRWRLVRVVKKAPERVVTVDSVQTEGGEPTIEGASQS